jgi:hypothetical protein
VKEGRFVGFLVLGALLLAGFVLLRPWARTERMPTTSPLAAIPVGAAFVLDIDFARLRRSTAGAELAKLGLRRFSGTGASDEFQPLRDVNEVVIAMPGSARLAREGTSVFEPGAVAVVAVGRFSGAAAADAAVDRIRKRGGEPVRTELGSFESVRDLGAGGEVAARDGMVVLSDGAYLRAVLAAAEGRRRDGTEAERASDGVHAELRRTFARNAPVTATLALPEGWLEAALRDPEVRASPLALVRSAAVRLDVAESLSFHVLLVCTTAEDCARVRAFVRNARDDLATALGPNPPHVEIAPAREGRVEFSFTLTTSELARALESNDAKR